MRRTWSIVLLLYLPGLAGQLIRLGPPLRVDPDTRSVSQPAGKQRASEMYAIVYNSWARHLSPENAALAARDKGALNVNAWDEAPDSSWFTNRMGLRTLSYEEIIDGLGGAPPEPGVWSVTRNIDEGYTPKLIVKDGAGRVYVVKFDLPSAQERNSGAERISTLILYAAGYNVPVNTITRFRAGDLRIAEGARYADAVGERSMTPEDLEAAFRKLKPMDDSRYRGLASAELRIDAGKFKYNGTRPDDPNDIIPHELRRELRGLRMIAAWINHADTGDKNTMDVFRVEADKSGYFKHYLLDFGSTLGSGDYTNGPQRVGHEYLFDGSAMARTLFSLGAWRRPWEDEPAREHPEIGHFDAALFNPDKWKPNYPNLAFVRADDGDGYWGAKIVTAYPDDLIDKLAEAGEYSRPEVTRYVAKTLKQRRDIIGRYWFDRVTPLEEFVLAENRLKFRDLAVERGHANAVTRKFETWTEDGNRRRLTAPQPCGGGCPVPAFPSNAAAKDRFGRVPMARVMVRSKRSDGKWALPVEIILGREGSSSEVKVLGWRHASR